MDETIETAKDFGQIPVDRRTVARGIGWGVPAVMVLGATPAFAGSKTEFAFTRLTPAVINAANSTPGLTAKGTGPDGATIVLKIGESTVGTGVVVDGEWSATIASTDAPEGSNVVVTAISSKGGDATKTYTKDITAPIVEYSSKTTAKDGKSGSATGTYGVLEIPTADQEPTYSDFVGGTDVTVTGFATVNGTWTLSWNYSGNGNVKEQAMSVNIRQTDGAGNSTTLAVNWTA